MIRMKEITNLCKILIDWYQFFSEIILPWIQLLRFFLFFIPRNRSCIRVSVGDSRQRGRLEKGAFYIFPGNFTVTWCRPLSLPFSLPSLLPIPASLFSFANSIGESFASCAPTVRKLNERLQLCSPPLQPAILSLSLSVCLSPRNCLFYKFIIGTTLRRNCQTCLPALLLTEFVSFVYMRPRISSFDHA